MKPKNGSTVLISLISVAVMVRERGGGAGGGEPRKHLLGGKVLSFVSLQGPEFEFEPDGTRERKQSK